MLNVFELPEAGFARTGFLFCDGVSWKNRHAVAIKGSKGKALADDDGSEIEALVADGRVADDISQIGCFSCGRAYGLGVLDIGSQTSERSIPAILLLTAIVGVGRSPDA